MEVLLRSEEFKNAPLRFGLSMKKFPSLSIQTKELNTDELDVNNRNLPVNKIIEFINHSNQQQLDDMIEYMIELSYADRHFAYTY